MLRRGGNGCRRRLDLDQFDGKRLSTVVPEEGEEIDQDGGFVVAVRPKPVLLIAAPAIQNLTERYRM